MHAHRAIVHSGEFDPRPPRTGDWHWQANMTPRAWLPLVGLDGLGLLDVLLAYADRRDGWTTLSYDHLCKQAAIGRAKLARLIRRLEACGLLDVDQVPAPGHGPAAVVNRYRVNRRPGLPTAAVLAKLLELGATDGDLARRLEAYAGPVAEEAGRQDSAEPAAPVQFHHGTGAGAAVEPEPAPQRNRSQEPPQDELMGSSPPAVESGENPADLFGEPMEPKLWSAIVTAAAAPHLRFARAYVAGDELLILATALSNSQRRQLADLAPVASVILGRRVQVKEARR